METAEPLDRGYTTFCKKGNAFSCGLLVFRDLGSVLIEEGDVRAARSTGYWLSVETPVFGILVFTDTRIAEWEGRHCGHWPVVREIRDYRESRAAIGAVYERIPVSPVSRVSHLTKAVVAGSDIRRYQNKVFIGVIALEDRE